MKTIFTITELTRGIKEVLEAGFSNVTVQGEISNCKLHSSGHCYLTLKDEQSQLSAVIWRSRVARLSFTPQDGMKVVARGNITLYEVRGVYQLDILQLQPLGVGELQLAFERLKVKLAKEGLFDADHKKPLPVYPRNIGIVTSSTGAAIRDIVNIISRRYPVVNLILYSVKVQGVGAAEEIAEAIRTFNEEYKVDVLIVGRGGGSFEDLWPFNEEIVARAIYDSLIPVVSAVGHEIDFTIADFVADLRAPTPSAAAELVVPDKEEILETVRNFCYTAGQLIYDNLSTQKSAIHSLLQSYAFNRPLDTLRQQTQRHDELRRVLTTVLTHRYTMDEQKLHSLQQRIASLSPDGVLKRGYTMVMKGNRIISDKAALEENDPITVRFHDGTIPATVNKIKP
ncbi:MAG: exodeoxyribonuclease VII large subunit [Bacteroidota bacterium]